MLKLLIAILIVVSIIDSVVNEINFLNITKREASKHDD